MKANRSTRQPSRAAAAVCLTSLPSSPSRQDDLVPRFVRATQILMLGAERRRAAEAAAAGSEGAK